MRVTNLLLHIFALILMLPALLFVGINSFMGLAYSRGLDTLIILVVSMIYAADFLASTVGVIILFASYKSTGPKAYMKNELIIHGLSALCYVIAIIYLISISMSSSSFDSLGTWLLVDFAGLAVCLAGITVTVVCSIKRNRRG